MNARGLVGLAVVAALLGAVLFIDLRHRSGGGERPGARERLLPPFDRNAVRRITIRRQGGERFSLQHTPSPAAPAPAPGWQIEIPGAPAADDATIADLLSALDLAESDRVANISPETAGLQPPAVEIDVEAPAGVLSAQLGHADATGQGVYARAGTRGPIRVIGRRLLEVADRDRSAFRDRRLFPVDPAAVTAIGWTDARGAGAINLVDGRWQNERKEWVDDGRVLEALRRLFALRIDRFEPGRLAPSGAPRQLSLTAGPTRIALEIGEPGDIMRGNEHVRVPADAFEAAARALWTAAARDTRLVAMPPDTVTRIDLFDDRRRVGLRRVDGAWTFTTPKVAYPADTHVVDEWLARLGAVRVATRPDGPRPRHLIVEGRFREAIEVAAPPDVYALLAPDPLRFRERTLLSFARFDVRRLQRQVGKAIEQLTTEDGTVWRTGSGEVDTANAARVAAALSDLRAEEFLAAPPAGEPALLLEIDVQQPGEAKATRHVVRLWPENDGGCAAHLDGEATFKPERPTCDALRLNLLKKAD